MRTFERNAPYDAASQLDTAQQGSTTWQYTYDANGSLISDGVKTYTYDSANRLVESVISHQQSAWTPRVSLRTT